MNNQQEEHPSNQENTQLPQNGYAPQPQDGYAPQPQNGYAPQPQNGYAPQPQNGYAPQPQEPFVPQPSSNIGLAVFTTLCCCLPFGIIALIKGSEVNKLYAAKQYSAAIAASNAAKNWCIYGIIAYFIIDVILLIIYLVGGAAALSFLPWSDMLQ